MTKKEIAWKALDDIFYDTSVPQAKRREDLTTLLWHIEYLLNALRHAD